MLIDFKNSWVSSSKRREKGVKYLNISISFDIETTSFYDNEVKRAYCYIWQICINGQCYYGRYLQEFQEFIYRLTKILKLNEKRKIIIYVHNLSYEFEFIKNYFTVTDVFARSEHKPIYCEFNNCVIFKCSYILTNKSLEMLSSETAYNKQIGNLDYTKLRHSKTELTEKELDYCKYDILVVYDYIRQQIEKEKNITKIPLTSTGYVRRFTLEYIKNNYNFQEYKKKISPIFPTDSDLFTMLEKAFSGGYTHANFINTNSIIYNVKSIDFTSSYPFCMVGCKFPMKKFQKIKLQNKEHFRTLVSDRPSVFTIAFKKLKVKTNISTLSLSKCRTEGETKKDNGRILYADYCITTITDIDLKIIDMFYAYDDYRITDFYVSHYDTLPKPILECVLSLYSDKTTLKDVDGKEDEYLLKKALLNSLYGMCVTSPLNDEIIVNEFNLWETIELNDKKTTLENYYKKYNTILAYQWGVWITAHARYNLLKMVHIINDDVVYCDTDSIKFKNYEKYGKIIDDYNNELFGKAVENCKKNKIDVNLLSPVDIKGNVHKLGVFTDEGNYSYFKTLGAKRYISCNDNKIKITVSGLNKKMFYGFLETKFIGNAKDKYFECAETEIQEIFNFFNDGLYVPPEWTGKLTHTYIDDKYETALTDYNGKTDIVSAESYIHLEKQDYELGIDYYFKRLIEVANFELPRRVKALYKKYD